MHFINRQREELAQIAYPLTRAADFDAFWGAACDRVDAHPLRSSMERSDEYQFEGMQVYDTTVDALDGTALRAWTLIPDSATGAVPAPVVLCLHGGNGSRGVYGWLPVVLSGCIAVIPDFRMQGGITGSATPMRRCGGQSFACLNLDQEKENYYFYHAFTDQLLMLRFAGELPQSDPQRIAVTGASQGGGTALILAALRPAVALCFAAVPSYCCWERRVFTRTACAGDIAKYIEGNPAECERVFRLLSYFDVMNFADRVRCRVVCTCGLKDESTPADCTYAAYNRITADKRMLVYPFGGHSDDMKERLNALRQTFFCR